MGNADDQKSESMQIIGDDSKNSDIGLKTWNSLPILDKNHSIVAIKDSDMTSPIIQESNNCSGNSNKNNQSCTVKLADIINVNYSDLKQFVNSNVDKLMVKPRTPVRKTKNRMKTRHNQNKIMFENPFSNVDGKIKDAEETRSIAISTETRSAAMQQLSSNKIGNIPMGSAPEFLNSWSLEVEGQKDIRTPRKSFMEDGGSSVQPMATGYFPRPAEGQSLTSFLSSAQFSRAHDAELDRENAHFSICEAMIAAIEQVKYNRLQRRLDETADDESDEEINRLKQRIRLRRRQRQEEKYRGRGWTRDLLSDGRTDTTTTTDQSISPLSTSSGSSSDNVSTEDFEDSEQENEQRSRSNSLFASTIISHTDAESHQARLVTESTPSESSVSAEGVALSLISRFSEKQLPRASELEWLVSEKDAPQRLLPMPKSWPVSPDEVENEDTRTIPLRGTVEWAPPRPQIIFTPHPPPV